MAALTIVPALFHTVKDYEVLPLASYSSILLNLDADDPLNAHAVKRHGLSVGTDLVFVRPSTKRVNQFHVERLHALPRNAP